MTRLVLPAAMLLGLAACGGDGSSSTVSGDTDTVAPTDGSNDESDEDVGSDVDESITDSIDTGLMGDDVDLSDASPRIITSACGALEIANLPVSTSRSEATSLMEGQLARGRIDPAIAANTVHYWRVDLQPGYHHLFVDTQRVDGEPLNLGLTIEEIGPDGETIEQLIQGNVVERRARFSEFFVNGEPRTLTLRVEPNFAAEDYVIGIFGNGRSIPSPYFETCPVIDTLSVGTTAATRLSRVDSEADVSWYRIELAEGAYLYDSRVTRVDGADSNLVYSVDSVEGFGELSTRENILRVNEVASVSREQATFERPAEGPIWLRLRNSLLSGLDVDVEFTLERQGT